MLTLTHHKNIPDVPHDSSLPSMHLWPYILCEYVPLCLHVRGHMQNNILSVIMTLRYQVMILEAVDCLIWRVLYGSIVNINIGPLISYDILHYKCNSSEQTK